MAKGGRTQATRTSPRTSPDKSPSPSCTSDEPAGLRDTTDLIASSIAPLPSFDGHDNFIHFSPVPISATVGPCVLGIDEAGRGPVLGPMVYGIVYCVEESHDKLKSLGVDDSKVLSEAKRDGMAQIILQNATEFGWAIHSLSPQYISRCMNRRGKYNLNSISHDTAIGLIRQAIERGVNVAKVFVDTVGPPEKYQAKLEALFPDIFFTVAKKADALFPCVSAASIMAKTTRDRALKEWPFPEGSLTDSQSTAGWGSGYPGDPMTKKFLQDNVDPVFGFPSVVRFSWKTAANILENKAVRFEFEEIEAAEDEYAQNNPSIKDYFFSTKTKSDIKRPNFFKDAGLISVAL
eukprot:TCALIF_00835-PA protein Name:"Similar to CG13690 Ribonuclease H2 subunit A (Drosophila melanogaster)" AED:0.44 eAED:0.44 QI:0/0/0/0.5/1/1/2/0/347